ncbi:MFS transporter [Bowdeniella nasicola]|nr:MFS transporter [Bowdeniella nasicola]
MITRGLAYGGAIAAVFPTAQAYLISRSPTEDDRVKAVGALGAVQGLSAIVGAILGGSLAALGGLLLPISVMPFAVLASAIVLAIYFRPQDPTFLVEQPRSISYRNPNVLPYLITGFALFLSFASIQTVLGFAVQDRFGLDATATAAVSAILMLIMSVTMAITQAWGVRRLGWEANTLLRVGLPLAAVGYLLLVPHTWTTLVLSCLFVGVGVGMAMPGYTAGPTLYLDSDEQGSLAGLINANNGITYAIAPVLSTSLYGLHPDLPFVLTLTFMAVVSIFVHLHPRFRSGTPAESSLAAHH